MPPGGPPAAGPRCSGPGAPSGGGAAAAVSRIATPAPLARRVMDGTRHVLLAGEGALAFARAQGLPECDPQSLVTERQLARHRQRAVAAAEGTVGAVALDRHGAIAAATSTGGIAGTLPRRRCHSPPV